MASTHFEAHFFCFVINSMRGQFSVYKCFHLDHKHCVVINFFCFVCWGSEEILKCHIYLPAFERFIWLNAHVCSASSEFSIQKFRYRM